MFELVSEPDRITVGEDLVITFDIDDKFNKKNYVGKYIYLYVKKSGTSFVFDTYIQRYNGEKLLWDINQYSYNMDGTFLVEARSSSIATQSSNANIIGYTTFIVNKKMSEQLIDKNNITSIKNEKEQRKCYKYNIPNDKIEKTESITSKVSLNIKPFKTGEKEKPKQDVIYSGVMKNTGKNVNSK